MRKRYKIIGVRRFGDIVRLTLELDELIKEKKEFNPLEILNNPENLQKQMQDMQGDALIRGQPDMITISYAEWEKQKFKIDDFIWLDINKM